MLVAPPQPPLQTQTQTQTQPFLYIYVYIGNVKVDLTSSVLGPCILGWKPPRRPEAGPNLKPKPEGELG